MGSLRTHFYRAAAKLHLDLFFSADRALTAAASESKIEKIQPLLKTGLIGQDAKDLALWWVVAHNKPTAMNTAQLLLDAKADSNRYSGSTVIEMAAGYNNAALAELLLARGFNRRDKVEFAWQSAKMTGRDKVEPVLKAWLAQHPA